MEGGEEAIEVGREEWAAIMAAREEGYGGLDAL